MSSDFSLTPYYFKEAESRSVLLAALHFPSRSEVPPDAALPQRLVRKDVRAFEQLYTLHSHTVYALVFRIVQQSSIAEEVVQDVFLHLWRNAAQYDSAKGAFVPPTLLTLSNGVDGQMVHEMEVFGPVATVVPYRDKADAFALARRGGGSLAASVFSDDTSFLAEAAVALGTTHGRLLLVDPSIGDSHTGHGIVLPSLMHGGPGRAGGGERVTTG